MREFNISCVETELDATIRYSIDNKTKPLGALGKLESLAFKMARVQATVTPQIKQPHIVVFAADHGVAEEGVSAFPAEVTQQMVHNFLDGGAAINVFAKQFNIELQIVDAGVNHDFVECENLVQQKIAKGTRNFLYQAAMNDDELTQAINYGCSTVDRVAETHCNVIGFGEMGIGNTSAASLIMSQICQLDIGECVGAGTGLDPQAIRHKIAVLEAAYKNHGAQKDPWQALRVYGGFEIAQMCAAMLRAAEKRMLILVDGFIASAAFLVAHALYPAIVDYAVLCHQSHEQGHKKMLAHLNMPAVLDLDLRLGEGTGCALVMPVLESAVLFLNDMASFDSANISHA